MRRWLVQNLGLKLSSFLLAVVVWAYLHPALGKSPVLGQRVIEVPVRVLQSASSVFFARVEPETARVTIRGPREKLEDLTPESIEIYVDVSAYLNPGKHSLRPRHAEPPWAEVGEISPDIFEVTLERK